VHRSVIADKAVLKNSGLPLLDCGSYIFKMIKLDQDQCMEILSTGDIPAEVSGGNEKVAVIFTQSWCVDWLIMRSYARKIDNRDVSVYYVEYDKEPFYEEMRRFKETVYNNWSIPYVRYYRDGRLVGTTNLIFSKRGFLKQFLQ
jgi:hypothetical protein